MNRHNQNSGNLEDLDRESEAALEKMSQDAFESYRENIAENEEVLTYFEEATPVRELEHVRIGSRPTRRGGGRGLADLRAIPWVWLDAEPPCSAGIAESICRSAESNSGRVVAAQAWRSG